jgi:leucyl-tRNA synthetase
MPLVERWGADTMRLMMLFAGPFEDDIDWKLIAPDPDRKPGVTTWLGRVVAAVGQAAQRGAGADEDEELVRLTHKTIKGVTEDLDRFRFNTAISKLMVLTNEIRATLDEGDGALAASRALVQMLAPFAPFSTEELWRVDLGEPASVHLSDWPTYDPALVVEDTTTLVVQVNGKVRDKVEVAADISEEDALAAARASAGAQRALEGREVVKEIVRAPKLVNFVVKG